MELAWLRWYLGVSWILSLDFASSAVALQLPDGNIKEGDLNWKWEFVDEIADPFNVRLFGQTCQIYTNASTQYDELLVFAGYHANPKGPSNAMFTYNFVTGQALVVTQHAIPGGSIPWKRDGAASILDPTRRTMLVFGGSQAPAQALGDTWELDIPTSTWTEYTPAVRGGPSRRYGSSIVYIPEWTCALLFAGSFWQEQLYYNDMWCYYFSFHGWEVVTTSSSSSPAPRAGHTAVYYEGYMYIYGGGDKETDFSTVWTYSMGDIQWRVVLNSPPPGRAWMQSVIVQSHWVVIGGARNSTDNLEVWRWPISPGAARGDWEQVEMGGVQLSGRMDHCVVNHNNGSAVYLFGGFSYEDRGPVGDFVKFKYDRDDRN